MLTLKELTLLPDRASLDTLPEGKVLVTTVNAHSFNVAQGDPAFAEALKRSDVLIPDGMSIVWACRLLRLPGAPRQRCAGWDLFVHGMEALNRRGGKCLFMGSSEKVLAAIRERAAREYPRIVVDTYSPPFEKEFSEETSKAMVDCINASAPDLLWLGMTAPKQEKWAWAHWDEISARCLCGAVGAVFDFYAGTIKRAPAWMQELGLEWLYRLVSDPRRLWRRYIIGNAKFLRNVAREL